MIPIHPHIAAMQPYALAKLSVPKGQRLLSLSQNESLRAPSPWATDAAARTLAQGQIYPDPDWTALRQALSGVHGLDPSGILIGAGSLDLIGTIARACAGPDRAILVPKHAYPFFRTAGAMVGARVDVAAEAHTTVDVDTLLAAQRSDTAIVCIANPGNPTGTRIPRSEIDRLRGGLRPDVLLIVDEAYGEFADHLNEPSWDLIDTGNTVVLRTFSKAYGLAGFRIGWGAFPPDLAANLRKIMNPNNLSAASQAAALAATRDQPYMRTTCVLTAQNRLNVSLRLRRAGLELCDSFANFVLVDFATPDRAQAANDALMAQGIVVRGQAGAGLAHTLRITIGDSSSMDRVAVALDTWMQEANHG